MESKESREDGDMDSEDLEGSPLIEPAPDHETRVVRKVLHVQTNPFDDLAQRENHFQTRCLVDGRSCSVIVDNGLCTNVCSKKMVDTLDLEIRPHAHPYKLN